MPDLHLWRLPIDLAALARIAREQRIPASDEDHGYTVHALLKALYGDDAPKPWRFQAERRLLWAYAPCTLEAGKASSDLADPLYHRAVDWEGAASKPMPMLARGRCVAFDLRACPVVRHGGRRGKDKASEHDYLLWRARRDGVEPRELDPRVVYGEWLCERAWEPEDAGAELLPDQVAVVGRRKPMERGANAWRGREERRMRLPDVTFAGALTVTSAEAFQRFLARGMGRHRAFGYGMLLLRPSGV